MHSARLQLVFRPIAAAALCAVAVAHAQSTAQRNAIAKTPEAQKPAPPPVPVAGDQTLDRIVAIVNGNIILDSDVNEEVRFSAFQPVSAAGRPEFTRERAVERLINRDLILQQAKLQPQDDISDDEVNKDIATLRRELPECEANGCATDTAWQRVLAAHGFTEPVFRERWRTRMEVLRFIDERFSRGLGHIPEADIKAFYEKNMLPEYAKRGVQAPPFADLHDRVEQVLLQQQVSALLGDWLKSLRAQGSVVVLKEGEVAP